jgi:cyclic pyranopterin phosphate synthase
MLVDSFNRNITYVRISITDRCNLRCKYCNDGTFPFIDHNDILRYEEIVRFVRIGAELGIRKVRLTGGEPLRRKSLAFLLREIDGMKPIDDISLTTNGVELAEQVRELKDAGLRRINISLDSLKRDRFTFITGVDALDRVLRSIEKAKEAGLDPVKVNTVIIRDFNDDEVLDFVEFAKKQQVHVRFIEFMPFGDKGLWDRSKIISSADLKTLIDEKHHLQSTANVQKGPARMFLVNGSEATIGFISPMSTHICHECNRIRLTPDGKIKPCLFSEQEYDVKGLMRQGASDEEVADFLKAVVLKKPERKQLEGGLMRKCQRSMRDIGG